MRRSRIRAMVIGLLFAGALAATAPSAPAGAEGNEAPAAPRAYRSLSAGSLHTCAIGLDGAVRCWGRNHFGQLGVGDVTSRGDEPQEMGDDLAVTDIGTDRRATAVTAGDNHTCALLDTGRVKCWGVNDDGQLGLGDTFGRGDHTSEMGDALPAVNLGTGRTATAITGGAFHTCALLDNGRVKCWGFNDDGQLGLGDTESRGDEPGELGNALPAVDLGTGRTATAIAGGRSHTCALLDTGRLKCWGRSTFGQLGYGDTATRGDAPGEMGNALPAVNLGTGRTATAITAGNFVTCALLDDGRVKCWGRSTFGQLGQGDTTTRGDAPGEMGNALPAVDLGTGLAATGISTNGNQACAVLDAGQVKCWGDNSSGQLGQGDVENRGDGLGEMGDALPPIGLGTERSAETVTVGDGHTCAQLSDATIRCWGNNTFGQLGLGDDVNRGGNSGQMGNALAAADLPPHNDDFLDAQRLDGGAGTIDGANAHADEEPGEPDHNGSPAADSTVWYRWSTTTAGPMRIDTFGSGFDTVLAVYTGNDLGALTPVAANDDASNPPSLASQVRFTTTAFTEYLIAVAGFNGTSGPITLTWRQIDPCDGRTVTVARAFGDTPTPGDDVIAGTGATETINGQGGNDRICGLGGNDTLVGGPGTDRLRGGRGNDTLQGGTADDHLDGGAGRDACNGGPQRDTATACETRTAIP